MSVLVSLVDNGTMALSWAHTSAVYGAKDNAADLARSRREAEVWRGGGGADVQVVGNLGRDLTLALRAANQPEIGESTETLGRARPAARRSKSKQRRGADTDPIVQCATAVVAQRS